jgi:putative phosphoesterase
MTRIGLVADIHGNAWALQLVLEALEHSGVDELVCLGDMAVLGPEPASVIDILRERSVPTVAGNTDLWLVPRQVLPADVPDSEQSRTLTEWTAEQIGDDRLKWIGNLPGVIERQIAGMTLLFCHSSPERTDDLITRLPIDIVERFGADVICTAHTHRQGQGLIGDVKWINPGSVGLPGVGPGDGIPIHVAPTWVEYAVIDITSTGIESTFCRLQIDITMMTEAATRFGMPHLDWWKGRWGSKTA